MEKKMVKRIVDTSFWTDMQVIDQYSVEDKYFSLYLMTNSKTTQVGIYPLPKKVISFETGFTSDVIQVLLDRFSQTYGKILYSQTTQEVSVLHSLQYTILKGGTPVSDLLEKELSAIKDGHLILATYEEMRSFWELSKRRFDQTVKEIFERELQSRQLFPSKNERENELKMYNVIDNLNENKNDNDNDNEESSGTIRGTNRIHQNEAHAFELYSTYLKQKKPEYSGEITVANIVFVYYEQLIGELHPYIRKQLMTWQNVFPVCLILEALDRSTKAKNPFLYVTSILKNWNEAGVENIQDVIELDKRHY